MGEDLNKLSNAFMLDPRSRTAFNSFQFSIAAEASPFQTTTYRVVTFRCLSYILNSKNATRAPLNFGRVNFDQLPDADLCNLHLAIAKVLHASGAKEAIQEFIDDQKDAPHGRTLAVTPDTSNTSGISYLNRKLGGLTVQGEQQSDESSDADDDIRAFNTVQREQQRGKSFKANPDFETYDEYLADLGRY